MFGENGNDLIIHNEGDGNDLIEGGLGRDTALDQAPRVTIESEALSGSISLQGGALDDLVLKRYRETIEPRQGGTGPDRRVTFAAYPGDTVIVSGADPPGGIVIVN